MQEKINNKVQDLNLRINDIDKRMKRVMSVSPTIVKIGSDHEEREGRNKTPSLSSTRSSESSRRSKWKRAK